MTKEKISHRNLVENIESLWAKTDIKQFYNNYLEQMKGKNTPTPLFDYEKMANENIGYALGDCEKEAAQRWLDTLPQIEHPIFGRYVCSIKTEDAFKAGLLLGKSGREAARQYIEEKYGK